jgi:hypothetical protein
MAIFLSISLSFEPLSAWNLPKTYHIDYLLPRQIANLSREAWQEGQRVFVLYPLEIGIAEYATRFQIPDLIRGSQIREIRSE